MPHILLVEDDRDIRDSVVEVLEEEGYSVAVASDGLEALRRLREGPRPPDLILLDLMMPNMNGFQFREEQLKVPEHAKIPVAVLTAHGDAHGKAKAMGVAGVLRKPVKIQALLDLVAGTLAQHPSGHTAGRGGHGR